MDTAILLIIRRHRDVPSVTARSHVHFGPMDKQIVQYKTVHLHKEKIRAAIGNWQDMTRDNERDGARRQGRIAKEKNDAEGGEQTVVVVDDESALNAIARLIRSAGFKVQMFREPKSVLAKRLPRRNVCLIADIYLPEMNGVELCDALTKVGHPIPTILITGRNDETARRLFEKSTAIAILFKPIDEAPLLNAISRCFDTSTRGRI
jgi:CheY-like chemotaxis protein